MIVDKKNKNNVVSKNSANAQHTQPAASTGPVSYDPSEMPYNGIIEVFKAIKTILKETRWKYNDPDSDLIFKTVQFNAGQYEYEVTGHMNTMYEIAYPAAYISFINMRWISSQNTINEGTAELRIQYVMNTLNNLDDNKDTELFYVGQRIIQTIQERRPEFPCLNKECKLTFMDTATYMHNGLQSCWLTYSIKFTEISVWAERNRIRRFIVAPPFTNHSDQKDPEIQNIHHHTNASHPRSYDEATSFDLLEEKYES